MMLKPSAMRTEIKKLRELVTDKEEALSKLYDNAKRLERLEQMVLSKDNGDS
jgi:hypothetical protein